VKNILYSSLNMSIYGYGSEYVGGIAYPKVQRQFLYAEPEKWAKAAIYNAAIVKQNPWVNYLKQNGVYKQIGQILREARQGYKSVNPAKRAKTLKTQLNRVQKIYNLVNADYPDHPELRQEYDYKIPYEEAKGRALARLIKQANRLGKELGVEVKLGEPSVPVKPEYYQ
jgi:hypothetical protein